MNKDMLANGLAKKKSDENSKQKQHKRVGGFKKMQCSSQSRKMPESYG